MFRMVLARTQREKLITEVLMTILECLFLFSEIILFPKDSKPIPFLSIRLLCDLGSGMFFES